MWLNDLFTLNSMYQFSAGEFNHCSSVAGHKKGAFVTWYAGSGECMDDQSVYVTSITNSVGEYLRIGDKTGNPIVWQEFNGKYYLLWSKFEESEHIKYLVDRWKWCSLWIQQIAPADRKWTKIILIGEPIKLAEPEQHLLARCNPITINKYTYLPLYDEYNGACVLYLGSDMKFKEICRFGHRIIQPTIWLYNGLLHALCRNFGNHTQWSQHYHTVAHPNNYVQIGKLDIIWGGNTRFYNMNSSIHVVTMGEDQFVLWNDVKDKLRRRITLGLITKIGDIMCPRNIQVLDTGASSYPSLAVDGAKLHMTYSDHDRKITYYVKNRKQLDKQKITK